MAVFGPTSQQTSIGQLLGPRWPLSSARNGPLANGSKELTQPRYGGAVQKCLPPNLGARDPAPRSNQTRRQRKVEKGRLSAASFLALDLFVVVTKTDLLGSAHVF